MKLVDQKSHIEVIDRDECVKLLGTQQVGRLGFVNGGTAEVLPVNYAMDGETVVFITAPGTKLASAERGTLTFEVDDTNTATRSGWSVIVHGFGEEIGPYTAPDVIDRLRALSLHPWAESADRTHLVRVVPTSISGRRVGRQAPPAELWLG